MKRYTRAALLAAALTAAGGAAYASASEENDALAIGNAKIPLTQAIAAAEQHANGKASKAEYEESKGAWVYDVEVVSGTKVFDVKVDADKGAVISSNEDKSDHDGGEDSAD